MVSPEILLTNHRFISWRNLLYYSRNEFLLAKIDGAWQTYRPLFKGLHMEFNLSPARKIMVWYTKLDQN
jgi:hypothetical protein